MDWSKRQKEVLLNFGIVKISDNDVIWESSKFSAQNNLKFVKGQQTTAFTLIHKAFRILV